MDGIDIILRAPPDVSVVDLILRYFRHCWPGSSFQDADQDDKYHIDDAWVSIHGTTSREFFIYRDRHAADAWAQEGAVASNVNTMLHFLVGDAPEAQADPREVTLVCDQRTDEIERLTVDLETTFRSCQLPALAR